jgi:two-component system response regulator HydG
MALKGETKDKLVFYEQLCVTLDDLHIGSFTVDSRRRITSFNRAAEQLSGFNAEEIVGKHCYQVFQNEFCHGECKFHEAVEAEQPCLSCDVEIANGHNEKRHITKIVTPLYAVNRSLMGCIEIFQDRSPIEELINRIRYDERRLKIILDNLDIGVFTVTRGGHITFFNTRAESITGYSRVEVLGKPCSLIFDVDGSEDASLLRQSILDGRHRLNKKGLMKTKKGDVIPIRASYVALRNEQGSIVGGLGTVQDLSLIYQLNRAIKNRYIFADMIGKDPALQKIFEILPVVSESEATVLIEGPTGTGKDLLAKVIHNSSPRANKAFVKVNCAALPDNLLESEMFGYVRGAFTGADRDKPGRFQEADGGTLFLDEIGDLPLTLQAKLLRVLEDKEFYPLGSRRTSRVDVRIIAATNQGLEELVEEKKFRKDLFYRLNVIRLELPPLRERRGDVALLIEHIFSRLSGAKETCASRISAEAMEILLNYEYPGNVRELENILEHALIICRGENIEPSDLPISLQKSVMGAKMPVELVTSPDSPSRYSEKERILEMLERCNWHRGKTASELHMDRTTLWRKMKKYSLSLVSKNG